ncbi:hypothetical protein EJB05_03505 [Eragrostis curvula]|uniref:DUF7795 domain-containing protein n=1 Tax=Eragrostis curvula TaxID=38414 RepID=A0A5J9W7X4_9POAL|nr:hypothetical protein EJB05_03505 [Eragrostis curvula]
MGLQSRSGRAPAHQPFYWTVWTGLDIAGRAPRRRRAVAREGMAVADAPPLPAAAAGDGESACRGVFSEFMTKVARFEEQAEAGKRLLSRFLQELAACNFLCLTACECSRALNCLVSEYFRRPPISENSDVMSEILKSNCTGRMKSYLEAGCNLQSRNISNINQLRLCEDGLKVHINEVKTLLQELECLVKDVHAITLTTSLSALKVSESPSADNELNNGSFMEEEEKQANRLDSDVSFVTVMIIVHNMLKLDYTMQEKIVNSLSLKTPSSELEGYCLMWDLRPYIDDNVMHLAWKMCP